VKRERRTGGKLKDDCYKPQLPMKQPAIPIDSTKTAGFGEFNDIPDVEGVWK